MSEVNETPEKKWENLVGFMTISDETQVENYKKFFQHKEQDGQTLFPFYKQQIKQDTILPSAVYYMFSNHQ